MIQLWYTNFVPSQNAKLYFMTSYIVWSCNGMSLQCNVIESLCLDWSLWIQFMITNLFCFHTLQPNPLFHHFNAFQSNFYYILDFLTHSNVPNLDYIPIFQTIPNKLNIFIVSLLHMHMERFLSQKLQNMVLRFKIFFG